MAEQSLVSESRKIALLIEYDGTQYSGWQRQKNIPTIQEHLERVMNNIAGGYCPVIGSGRTDAGVHAFGQVAHFRLSERNHLPIEKVSLVLNNSLPCDIKIRAASDVPDSFHARFGAVRREYRYYISLQHSVFMNRYTWCDERPFDPDLLQQTAELFPGTHNFTTFSKYNADTESYICTVERADWTLIRNNVWQFCIVANRFVYGMVRALVGVMMDVARGRRSFTDVQEALHANDRSRCSQLAPACGLVLWRIDYPEQPFATFAENEFPLYP